MTYRVWFFGVDGKAFEDVTASSAFEAERRMAAKYSFAHFIEAKERREPQSYWRTLQLESYPYLK